MSASSSTPAFPTSASTGKLERQNEKLFQLCHICLEILLDNNDDSKLKDALCGECDGSPAGVQTRDHIQHFLEHFVDAPEEFDVSGIVGNAKFPEIAPSKSSIVSQFKNLLHNINDHKHSHPHQHTSSYKLSYQKASLSPQNQINKNRRKALTNATSVLSLNSALQNDAQNGESIHRLLDFFKMQQESNRNITRIAYRQAYVEGKNSDSSRAAYRNLPRASTLQNFSNSSAVDKKILNRIGTSSKFCDLVLFCGSHDAEHGMDTMTNRFGSSPTINVHLEERILDSPARFSIGSLSDGEESDDSDHSTDDSDFTSDHEQSTSSVDSYDFESDIDQILTHIHNHNWFVLPNEAHVGEVVFDDLMKNVVDPNNVVGELNTLLGLWRNRFHLNCTRKHFLYQVMRFLFEKYVKVQYCLEHSPPCKPTVKYEMFASTAAPILKQFCEHINRTRHLVIQIELLAAIESFIYNRPHFRPAIGEIFNQLFTSGVIEAVAFIEWSKLQDPSSCFASMLPPTPPPSSGSSPVKSERSMSSASTKSTSSIKNSKLFKSLSKRFSLGSNQNTKPKCLEEKPAESIERSTISSRDKLFDEMRSSFPLCKKGRY